MKCNDIGDADCDGELWGCEIRGVYDGVLYWACASGHAWPRDFGGWERLEVLSAKYAAEFRAQYLADVS